MAEITLQRWARNRYGDDAPHDNTLRRWARDGYIYPLPRKQGRAYYVHENAIYLRPGEAPPPELMTGQKTAPHGRLVRKLIDGRSAA